MCEILTILAAIAFSTAFSFARKSGKAASALGSAALFLWGAALMWSVDCAKSFLDGEGFFDLSADDAKLGVMTVAVAFALYAIMAVRERFSARLQKA